MPIGITDRLTTSIVGTSLASNSWAANDHSLIIAMGWGFNGTLGISDTFVDTGGGTWQTIYNFSQASGAHLAAWYRILGTGPGTHGVTMSNTANDECVLGVAEITGNYDPNFPIRQNITGTTSTATLGLTLGAVPRPDSIVISNVFDVNNAVNTVTRPSGFTFLTSQTFDGDVQASAYLAGSGTASIAWGNFDITTTPDFGGYFEVQTQILLAPVVTKSQLVPIPPAFQPQVILGLVPPVQAPVPNLAHFIQSNVIPFPLAFNQQIYLGHLAGNPPPAIPNIFFIQGKLPPFPLAFQSQVLLGLVFAAPVVPPNIAHFIQNQLPLLPPSIQRQAQVILGRVPPVTPVTSMPIWNTARDTESASFPGWPINIIDTTSSPR